MQKQTTLTREAEQRKQPVEPPLSAPTPSSPSTVLELIERVALDPCADVEKLERLTAIHERLKAKEAELAFNAVKGRILKKLAGIKIVKNRPVLSEIDNGRPQRGVFEAFKYAPLEEIDKHLRPLLTEEQMDLSYSDEPWESGGILIRGRLKHLPSGHFEDSFMPGRSIPRVASRTSRPLAAPIRSCAAMWLATSSTSLSSAMTTTARAARSTRPRPRPFSI